MLKLNFWWACHKFWLIMRIRLCRALSQGAVAALPCPALSCPVVSLLCLASFDILAVTTEEILRLPRGRRWTLLCFGSHKTYTQTPEPRFPLPPAAHTDFHFSPKCPTQFIIQLNWPQSRISKFREFPQSSQFTVRRHLWAPLCFEWSFKVAHANPLMSFCRCHRLSFQ